MNDDYSTYELGASSPIAPQLRKGMKVKYQHGRGLATGKIVGIDQKAGKAAIKTKNGFKTSRPLWGLERA